MSVTVTTVLPAQPADGAVQIIPLGGDGLHAPRSMVNAKVKGTGDASGGYNLVTIAFEEVHQHMLYYVGLQLESLATADVEALHNYQWGAGASIQETTTLKYTLEGFAQANGVYRPPPIIASQNIQSATGNWPYFRVWVPNVDGQVLAVYLLALQFRTGARESTPFPYLVQNFSH